MSTSQNIYEWRTDFENIPKGEWVDTPETVTIKGKTFSRIFREYQAPKIILASKCGKVIASRWVPEDKKERRPVGYWHMFHVEEQPVAWMPWPTHPDKENNDKPLS